jgi:hypothetical protein
MIYGYARVSTDAQDLTGRPPVERALLQGPGEGEMDPDTDYDAARAELWQAVLPILFEGEDGSMEVVGTGFVVLANGRQAHLVTAGHVCQHIQSRDRPPRSHPTALSDFIAPEYRVELRHVRPFVIYRHPTRGACRVSIEAWMDLKEADLALCSIRFGELIPPDVLFEKRFPLDTRPVGKGEPICALGYAEGKIHPVDGGVEAWTFGGLWRQVSGTVVDPAPEFRLPGMTAARFKCDVTFCHAMSGGPVCSGGPSGEIVVRGVVSSGDLAFMIWQLLLMPASLPTTGGNITGRTLLDLEREGALIDRGRGSDHVHVERFLDNGQVKRLSIIPSGDPCWNAWATCMVGPEAAASPDQSSQ